MSEMNRNDVAANNRSKTTARLLGVVVALQVLTVLGQWVSPSWTSPAQAQIPDGGAQRNQIIDELKNVNSKLDRMISVLESGKLQVHADSADAKK
jgi:hypothetical protein